jgi:hypothetical protein
MFDGIGIPTPVDTCLGCERKTILCFEFLEIVAYITSQVI